MAFLRPTRCTTIDQERSRHIRKITFLYIISNLRTWLEHVDCRHATNYRRRLWAGKHWDVDILNAWWKDVGTKWQLEMPFTDRQFSVNSACRDYEDDASRLDSFHGYCVKPRYPDDIDVLYNKTYPPRVIKQGGMWKLTVHVLCTCHILWALFQEYRISINFCVSISYFGNQLLTYKPLGVIYRCALGHKLLLHKSHGLELHLKNRNRLNQIRTRTLT
jgi:hypothetical protein